jgi:hypothetical protein
MDSILLSSNPITGEQEWMHYDELTDTTYVEQRFDAEPIIDYAANVRNASFGHSRFAFAQPLAEIPLTMVYQWLKEGFDLSRATKQELARKLADYPKLKLGNRRTNPGIIISGAR